MKLMPLMAVVEAPSNLGLRPPGDGIVPGVYGLPDALRKTGVYVELGIHHIRRVIPPDYAPEIDPQTGIRNAKAIRDYTIGLANIVEFTIRGSKFPLVIGGDCSILLGTALALRRIGSYGLVFLDGHTDFQTPQSSRTGGAAGMDLALAAGYGPDLLTEFEGYSPLIRPGHIVALGFRDMDDPAHYHSRLIFEAGIQTYSLEQMRQRGISQTASASIEYLRRQNVDGIWLHLDVDVLDDVLMPAVDSRQPGGMTYEEVAAVIRALLDSGCLVGLQITILDPELDPDGTITAAFARFLSGVFQQV